MISHNRCQPNVQQTHMTVRRSPSIKLLALGLVLIQMTACGGRAEDDVAADQKYLQGQTLARTGSLHRTTTYRRIEQILPNRWYQWNKDIPPNQVSERAALGEFVGARPGRASRANGDEVPFNSNQAATRTLHFDFRVDESLGGDGPNPAMLGIAFDGGTDLDRASRGFLEMGKVVVFLYQSRVFDYQEGLPGLVEDGTMVAAVGADGRLSLPLVEPDYGAALLQRVTTIDALREHARRPARTTQLRTEEGVVYPADD